MAEALESLMLILFGISWPFSIAKSYKSRTNKGKSIVFSLSCPLRLYQRHYR